jgi:hypothetical protein
MWGLLALVVRKGSNFDPVLCGLSPPVSGGSAEGPHVYLLISAHLGVLLWQADPANKLLKTRVGVETVKEGVNFEVNHAGGSLLIGFV